MLHSLRTIALSPKYWSLGLALLTLIVLPACRTSERAEMQPVAPPPSYQYDQPTHSPWGSSEFEPDTHANQPMMTEPVAPTEEVTFSSAPPQPAQPMQPAAPTTYIIRKGDTLWSIARIHLGDPKRWVEIQNANPGLNPNKLPIGQTINLP